MNVYKLCLCFALLGLSVLLQGQVKTIENRVELSDMVITGEQDERAKNLIEEVIQRQKENSPHNLDAFQFKSYSKTLAKTIFDDVPDFEPKNKKDSANVTAYKNSKNNYYGLIEKGEIYAFKKGGGEKRMIDAIRISGIQAPLLEVAAVNPLPYAFEHDEFQFYYFRSFINPLSRKGLQHYDYKIQDTITLNSRKTIEVSFHNIDSKEKPLYGTLMIDAQDRALVEFYAEYKKDSHSYGSGGITVMIGEAGDIKYYLTSKYKKEHGVWFPLSQEYYRLGKTKYHVDSTQQPPKEYFKTSSISAEVAYLDHKNHLTVDEEKLKGYNTDISKEAFYDFDARIKAYRIDALSQQEKETYVVLDSIGKEENINNMIKYGRTALNGFNFPLGNVDVNIPALYSNNGHEGVRLGLKLQTNHHFHNRFGLEGATYYGFDDEEFKYMLGANYIVETNKNSLIGVRYTDDVEAFARPVSPLRTGLNAWREYSINGKNENYVDFDKFEVYGKTTFFENLDFLTSISIGQEQSLVAYAFDNFIADKTYKELGVDFFLRYSPNNEYLAMPYGRIPVKTSSPDYYLTGDFRTAYEGDGYESLRLQASVEHEFSWLNKTSHVLLRGGKVFGEAPLWRTFNQGLRGDESWFKPWRIGSSNNFETMPAMQFYSEQYIMAQWRQEWFDISKSTPVYTVIRGIYGDFENKSLHHNIPFETLKKGYFEGGIEARRLLFNALGLGAYYRFGDYSTNDFKENFALKLTLDLPFGNIQF